MPCVALSTRRRIAAEQGCLLHFALAEEDENSHVYTAYQINLEVP